MFFYRFPSLWYENCVYFTSSYDRNCTVFRVGTLHHRSRLTSLCSNVITLWRDVHQCSWVRSQSRMDDEPCRLSSILRNFTRASHNIFKWYRMQYCFLFTDRNSHYNVLFYWFFPAGVLSWQLGVFVCFRRKQSSVDNCSRQIDPHRDIHATSY